MTKRMLINASLPEEVRVAIVHDGVLAELDVETRVSDQVRGNIYKALITNVEPSLQAAFLDFGHDRHGFMPIGNVLRPSGRRSSAERTPIEDLLQKGDEVVVQVEKEQVGTKGATVSMGVSLAGRYMVLMPLSTHDRVGVSRKINDERARKRLHGFLSRRGFGSDVVRAGMEEAESGAREAVERRDAHPA